MAGTHLSKLAPSFLRDTCHRAATLCSRGRGGRWWGKTESLQITKLQNQPEKVIF